LPRENYKKLAFLTALCLLFGILVLKLVHLQIFELHTYLQYSERNRIRRLTLQPTRGLLYDRYGRVLVDNRPSYSLSAISYEYSKNDCLRVLLPELLNMAPDQIEKKLKLSEGPFLPVKLKSDIDFDLLVRCEERRLELPGIVYDVEPKRVYRGDINASHVFGYLGEISRAELDVTEYKGMSPGDIVGKKGLEKVYDAELRGKVGYSYVEVDALGREVEDVVPEEEVDPVPGNDLYLTLDLELQRLAEELFVERRGGAVLLDVRDGGALVLCSKPDYDPHIFSGVVSSDSWRRLVNDPDKPLFDRVIQSEYPPGSTFKPVLAAAALESGTGDRHEKRFCSGYMTLGRKPFHCWNTAGHGSVDLLEAIKGSCNVYFYHLSLEVGLDPWAEYAKKFGFGRPTGIDLLGEAHGGVPDREYLDSEYGQGKWGRGMLLNLGIGQGELLVTPLQMAQFAMILANRGSYFRPHLLDRTYDVVDSRFAPYQAEARRVEGISFSTYDILREGMFKAVNEEGGTGRASAVSGVNVAGKTGTAQNPHGESHAWYIGFAPYESPHVAICVLVENGGSGGGVAAPIAGKILHQYFRSDRLMAKSTRFVSRDDTAAE
jgi:penicillin-binding protein 2